MMTPNMSRRTFVKSSVAGAVAPWVLSHQVFGQGNQAANELINVGVIGVGSRGFNLIDDLLKETDARIVAISDPYELHYRDRKWGTGLAHGRKPAQQRIQQAYAKRDRNKNPQDYKVDLYYDFRDLCARSDIDAVVVATPDHWHALCTLEAIKRGKDVYCEKPVTHLFAEGQKIYQTVAATNTVFQTGSQQRSTAEFQQAVNLVRNGVLGTLKTIEVGLPPGYGEPQGDTSIQTPESEEQYSLWCGPSEVLPLMQARHHRWWRGHRAYGGGVLMDWIGHHNDIAHWSMDLDQSGPNLVEAVNWEFPDTDIYNTPHHYTIRCEYDNGVTSTISNQNKLGTKWIGEDGWLFVTRSKIEASNPQWLKSDFQPGEITVSTAVNHMRNFLDAVRSRKPCIAPAEAAHRSITPGHLAYVSQALGKPLKWNPATEQVVDNDEANTLLQTLSYRQPWSLPEIPGPATPAGNRSK